MPQAQPELKKYMEKRVFCQLNGNRKVIGLLRGYDVPPSRSQLNTCRANREAIAAPPLPDTVTTAAQHMTQQSTAQHDTWGGPTQQTNRTDLVFMNIVLDEAFEEKAGGEKVSIGMVVIRGNSVVMIEALERISDK
ncbi:unnamed protein product [Penicillium manginii]